MIHVLAALALFLLTVAWFVLALLPALREHFSRYDIEPLRLSSGADIRFFALSFRRHVEDRLERLRAAAKAKHTLVTPLDRDVVWYASPSSDTVTVFQGHDDLTNVDNLTVIAESSLRVPSETTVSRELFTGGSLDAGARAAFRAVLVDGDASFGEETTIVRWADAGGAFRVGRASTLWGRASSWGPMSLAEGTRFERIAAPRIVFGTELADRTDRVTLASHTPLEPPKGATVSEGRWAIEGNFEVPDGAVVPGDLVVSGALTLGRGAKIEGAVRAHTIVAAERCEFARSIMAERSFVAAERCSIVGPVAVEGSAILGTGCRVGDTGDETTISAITVRVASGVVLCGEVWARTEGLVVDHSSTDGLPGESDSRGQLSAH